MKCARGCVFRQVGGDDGRDGHSRQLLEGQAEGHGLHIGQVMHHQLAALCEHDDGHGVIILIDGPLRGDQGEPLDSPKPGKRMDVLMLPAVFLQQSLLCQAWLRDC